MARGTVEGGAQGYRTRSQVASGLSAVGGWSLQCPEKSTMDESEEMFGGGDGDSSPTPYEELVTAMADGLYGELERLVAAHGSTAVSGLLPQLVSVLESLQGACGQVRERDQALERVRDDRLRLLEQYERERSGRKRADEVSRSLSPRLL